MALFNRQAALARCFDNEQMLNEMVQCFLSEVECIFPAMQAALKQGNLTEVGDLGHRMKGTVVYLAAEAAYDAACRVERLAYGSGAPSQAEQDVAKLEEECLALKAELRQRAVELNR
jgi:HPt (histidine-containing phosphotransfer) domain-containing protein